MLNVMSPLPSVGEGWYKWLVTAVAVVFAAPDNATRWISRYAIDSGGCAGEASDDATCAITDLIFREMRLTTLT
jgi:hypothetical protein